ALELDATVGHLPRMADHQLRRAAHIFAEPRERLRAALAGDEDLLIELLVAGLDAVAADQRRAEAGLPERQSIERPRYAAPDPDQHLRTIPLADDLAVDAQSNTVDLSRDAPTIAAFDKGRSELFCSRAKDLVEPRPDSIAGTAAEDGSADDARHDEADHQN